MATFTAGDRVTWAEQESADRQAILANLRREFGEGPFEVLDTQGASTCNCEARQLNPLAPLHEERCAVYLPVPLPYAQRVTIQTQKGLYTLPDPWFVLAR
ncbi:MAG: hypothetical protein HY436_01755 [Candidatus Liptonbacteria bacterium]|nr:hypothetical protein [Candidatus Liptonbacteria bacterium]